jgi:hypothetical protein
LSRFRVKDAGGNAGIWMWSEPLHDAERDVSILIIDTELEASEDKKAENIKIIALAFLLSSLFIHNSKGDIDEKSCASLSIATEFATFINQ